MTLDDSDDHRSRMVGLLTTLAVEPGIRPTIMPSVKTMRVDRTLPRSPAFYEPSIVLIAQGRKRGFLGDRTFAYDPQHFLALTVPLPFECETFAAGDGRPMLGMKVGVDVELVTELMAKLPGPPAAPAATVDAIAAAPIDVKLGDAAVKLLECLTDPDDARVLGPQALREVIYRVLRGPHGEGLRALAAGHGKLARIRRALDLLHEHFGEPMDVAELARAAAMSTSAFHRHFRAVTATSPLQYLKHVRLHKARMLMVSGGLTASEAALRVGYESASQFSREFKRLFGRSPHLETARMRSLLALETGVAPAQRAE